jgi:antitoxin component YwqK of YwqJK toxin-antitoxin module
MGQRFWVIMTKPKRVCEELLDWDEDVSMLDGVPYTGSAFLMFTDGALKRECYFQDGFEQGECKEWYSNGQVRKQWIAQRGVATGDVKTWHENGQLKSIGNFEFGAELHYEEWDATGKLIESRHIEKESELMKYVEMMRERAKA